MLGLLQTLPSANNSSYRYVNPCSVTRQIAQEVNISSTKLLWQRKSRHTSIVLHLEIPIWRGLHIVGHRRPHKARRDRVHSDTMFGPLHGQCVRHISDSCLGTAIRSAWSGTVRPVRCHGCGKDNAAFDAEGDELACSNLGTGIGPENL